MRRFLLLLLLPVFNLSAVKNCECNITALDLSLTERYSVIFKGHVMSVKACGDTPGEAVFEVDELYKGNTPKNFTILFKCDDPCYAGFNAGDEWIIYSNYRQIQNAMMDWCSRSRKYYRIEKEDIYSPTYGITYSEEKEFLQKHLGLHRLLSESLAKPSQRNVLPGKWQTITILICSLGAIILFYWLFNRYAR
jgi:hypothetical protein